MVTLCSIKGPLNHLWFLDYLLYVGPFTFWPYYKTINIYFMVLYKEHWTFILLPLHLKYFMMIFYLSYLPYIRLSFSSVVTSSSEVSLLVHECPSPAFFFIFPLVTSAYSDSYFNVTGLLRSSTVTMQASAYFLCMIVMFCPTRHLLNERASSSFLF